MDDLLSSPLSPLFIDGPEGKTKQQKTKFHSTFRPMETKEDAVAIAKELLERANHHKKRVLSLQVKLKNITNVKHKEKVNKKIAYHLVKIKEFRKRILAIKRWVSRLEEASKDAIS